MEDKVLLGHGSGGTMMKRIIDEVFFDAYAGEELKTGDDAAVLTLPDGQHPEQTPKGDQSLEDNEGTPSSSRRTDKASSPEMDTSVNPSDDRGAQAAAMSALEGFSTFSTGKRIAFSTDSYVVTPHFFPGGNIGKLAICGTVNDVATSGAKPLYLSCGFVLEEGYPIDDLRKICQTMAETAREAGVTIVTGDTKVVNRGHGDGVFINTSGVGIVPDGLNLSGANCKPGDKVLVTGTLGDHGITIMSCRESLSFTADVESDAAPLNHLIQEVLAATGALEEAQEHAGQSAGGAAKDAAYLSPVRCFRDPTRGGLASTLNELAEQSGVDITIEEEAIPVRDVVIGACDMLGYDVLQVANEGKMVCVVSADKAEEALEAMRANPYGRDAAIIGEVSEMQPDRGSKVYVRNAFGGRRILDMLVGEQLPRIC